MLGEYDAGYEHCIDSMVRQMEDMQFRIDCLHAENAKLREELAKARDPQRIGGQADPSSFVYAIEQLREFRWQHATNDEDAIPYINNVAAAHERENAKLRELCEEQLDNLMPEICAKAWWCDGKDWHTCNDDACGNYTFVILARELGVEVE